MTCSVLTSNTINAFSDFINNTSAYRKNYANLVGAVASLFLSLYYFDKSISAKTCPLVGRCASLFMAGDLLHSQLGQSWTKIAVTAIKTTSICLGIASIALSSHDLLVNSLICDILGHFGSLTLALYHPTTSSIDNAARSLLKLTSNFLVLGAISLSSPALLISNLLINLFVNSIILGITWSNVEDLTYTSCCVLFVCTSTILLINYVDGVIDETSFDIILPPLDASMVNAAALIYPFIHFDLDIFREWNESTL